MKNGIVESVCQTFDSLHRKLVAVSLQSVLLLAFVVRAAMKIQKSKKKLLFISLYKVEKVKTHKPEN